jgi:hypothetical protein
MIRRVPHVVAVAVLAAGAAACEQALPTDTQVVQLALVAGADHGGAPFRVAMSQELTTTVTGDADGTGFATIAINIGQREVCWDLQATGVQLPATAAHIHRAAPGLSGPIVVGLSAPDASGTASGCTNVANRDLLKDILQQPEGFYVNVHTAEFPAGAIRAQLGE